MLDAAVVLGGSAILVIPAVVGRAEGAAPLVPYAEALARTHAALVELGFEAEARGDHAVQRGAIGRHDGDRDRDPRHEGQARPGTRDGLEHRDRRPPDP